MPKPNVLHAIVLVILLFNACAGQPVLLGNDNVVTANVIKGRSRKFLTEIQDYDYGGPNSRHDPRRRPGRNG